MERGKRSAMLDGDVIRDAQIRGAVMSSQKTGSGSKNSIFFFNGNSHKT